MDLSTTYLGFQLPSPLMPGSSPMTNDLDTVRRLVDAGAAAIVMHSIYQEQIAQAHLPLTRNRDGSPSDRLPFDHPHRFVPDPKHYLNRIDAIKAVIRVPLIASIPLIASMNCTTPGSWATFAGDIQAAGADALELNAYVLPTRASETAGEVEDRLIEMVRSVKDKIQIPLAIKLFPFYTSLPHLVSRLEAAGASGVVIFNRFYQSDISVRTKSADPQLDLSRAMDSMELRLRLHWLAILSPQTQLSLALTGGVHTGLDALKGIMAGAHAIQVVSSLLNEGPDYLETIRAELERHLRDLGMESLDEVRGCMNFAESDDPEKEEREAYLAILQKWKESNRAGMHAY